MIAFEKRTFLEFETVDLYNGSLSRTQSDSSLYKPPSKSSSKPYFFNFHTGPGSITSRESGAQGKHDEISVVEDAAMRHVDSFDIDKRDTIQTPCKQLRPNKKQRALFAQFVKEQKAKLIAQPHDFDIESIDFPINLWRKGGIKSSLDQLKRTLYELKATLTAHACQ